MTTIIFLIFNALFDTLYIGGDAGSYKSQRAFWLEFANEESSFVGTYVRRH